MEFNGTVKSSLRERAEQLTPAKREGFEQGAAAALSLMAERGMNAAIGQDLQKLINTVNDAQNRGNHLLSRLAGLDTSIERLDERGAQIVDLTATLMKVFMDAAEKARSKSHSHESISEQEMIQIVRAVSYMVWAYTSGSTSFPDTSDKDQKR